MNLRITLEIGDYDYSSKMEQGDEYGGIWISDIKKIIELTPYEIEKHREMEEVNRMFLLTLKSLNEEYKKYVLLSNTPNIRKQDKVQ